MIFRMQRNSTALRTVPRPKLISAGHLVLAENKATGILLPNPPSGIGDPLFLRMQFPVRPKRIPCSREEQGIMRKALGLQRKPTEKADGTH